jgi:hypothetical protein
VAVTTPIDAKHRYAPEPFDLRQHRQISCSVDVRDEVDEMVLESHPFRRPEQRDQRDAPAQLVRQTGHHEGRDVRATGVSDHDHSIPPPCRHIVPDDACQVSRTLVRRTGRSEIHRRIEPHDRNSVRCERSGEASVRGGPSAIASDENGEHGIGSRRGNLDQREIGNVTAGARAMLNSACTHAEGGGKYKQEAPHLAITPRKPPEISAARLSSTRGRASPP